MQLVSRLLDEEGVAEECWRGTVLRIAREVVAKVRPQPRLGDDIDINRYVDFTLVPGGSVGDTRVVDGAILRRNYVHRKMKNKEFTRPVRFLIIEAGVELTSDTSRVTTLSRLLEQEAKALEIFLAKLLSRRPDVLLLGRSICRSALEALLSEGILVLHNVHSAALHRIARLTGAEVLESTEHLTHISVSYGNDPIGYSGGFKVVPIYDDPEVLTIRN